MDQSDQAMDSTSEADEMESDSVSMETDEDDDEDDSSSMDQDQPEQSESTAQKSGGAQFHQKPVHLKITYHNDEEDSCSSSQTTETEKPQKKRTSGDDPTALAILRRQPLDLQHGYRILLDLMSDRCYSFAWPFIEAVDPVKLNLPDYHDRIKKPMWLGKIEEKFEECAYPSIAEFVADVRLILENCYRYNGLSHPVSRQAETLEAHFERKLGLLSRHIREKTYMFSSSDSSSSGRRRFSQRILDSNAASTPVANMVRRDLEDEEERLRKQKIIEKREELERLNKRTEEWEKEELLKEPYRTQLRAMWEIPAIGQFLKLCGPTLLLPEFSLCELERAFFLPQSSQLLAYIFTHMLTTRFYRPRIAGKQPMPYPLWQERLRKKFDVWFAHFKEEGATTQTVARQIYIPVRFFEVLGETNPLVGREFHDLSVYERVWVTKGLCDHFFETDLDAYSGIVEETFPEDQRPKVLGQDADKWTFLCFPHFMDTDLRIYRQARFKEDKHKDKKAKDKKKPKEEEQDAKPSPAKRGRKPKAATPQTGPTAEGTPGPRPRGRPRKDGSTPLQAVTPKPGDTSQGTPGPRPRGRPRKDGSTPLQAATPKPGPASQGASGPTSQGTTGPRPRGRPRKDGSTPLQAAWKKATAKPTAIVTPVRRSSRMAARAERAQSEAEETKMDCTPPGDEESMDVGKEEGDSCSGQTESEDASADKGVCETDEGRVENEGGAQSHQTIADASCDSGKTLKDADSEVVADDSIHSRGESLKAAGGESPKTAVGESPKPAIEESPKAAIEQSPKAGIEESPKAGIEEAPKADIEESPKAAIEESPKADIEESPKADIEEAPKADIEESPKAAIEESPKADIEESPKTAIEESPKADIEESPKTAIEESPKADIEESPKAATGESPKAAVGEFPEGTPGESLSEPNPLCNGVMEDPKKTDTHSRMEIDLQKNHDVSDEPRDDKPQEMDHDSRETNGLKEGESILDKTEANMNGSLECPNKNQSNNVENPGFEVEKSRVLNGKAEEGGKAKEAVNGSWDESKPVQPPPLDGEATRDGVSKEEGSPCKKSDGTEETTHQILPKEAVPEGLDAEDNDNVSNESDATTRYGDPQQLGDSGSTGKDSGSDKPIPKELLPPPPPPPTPGLSPPLDEFELVCDSVESLRALVEKFNQTEETITKGRKTIVQPIKRSWRVVELGKALASVLEDVEPEEKRLVRVVHKAREKLYQEMEAFKKDPSISLEAIRFWYRTQKFMKVDPTLGDGIEDEDEDDEDSDEEEEEDESSFSEESESELDSEEEAPCVVAKGDKEKACEPPEVDKGDEKKVNLYTGVEIAGRTMRSSKRRRAQARDVVREQKKAKRSKIQIVKVASHSQVPKKKEEDEEGEKEPKVSSQQLHEELKASIVASTVRHQTQKGQISSKVNPQPSNRKQGVQMNISTLPQRDHSGRFIRLLKHTTGKGKPGSSSQSPRQQRSAPLEPTLKVPFLPGKPGISSQSPRQQRSAPLEPTLKVPFLQKNQQQLEETDKKMKTETFSFTIDAKLWESLKDRPDERQRLIMEHVQKMRNSSDSKKEPPQKTPNSRHSPWFSRNTSPTSQVGSRTVEKAGQEVPNSHNSASSPVSSTSNTQSPEAIAAPVLLHKPVTSTITQPPGPPILTAALSTPIQQQETSFDTSDHGGNQILDQDMPVLTPALSSNIPQVVAPNVAGVVPNQLHSSATQGQKPVALLTTNPKVAVSTSGNNVSTPIAPEKSYVLLPNGLLTRVDGTLVKTRHSVGTKQAISVLADHPVSMVPTPLAPSPVTSHQVLSRCLFLPDQNAGLQVHLGATSLPAVQGVGGTGVGQTLQSVSTAGGAVLTLGTMVVQPNAASQIANGGAEKVPVLHCLRQQVTPVQTVSSVAVTLPSSMTNDVASATSSILPGGVTVVPSKAVPQVSVQTSSSTQQGVVLGAKRVNDPLGQSAVTGGIVGSVTGGTTSGVTGGATANATSTKMLVLPTNLKVNSNNKQWKLVYVQKPGTGRPELHLQQCSTDGSPQVLIPVAGTNQATGAAAPVVTAQKANPGASMQLQMVPQSPNKVTVKAVHSVDAPQAPTSTMHMVSGTPVMNRHMSSMGASAPATILVSSLKPSTPSRPQVQGTSPSRTNMVLLQQNSVPSPNLGTNSTTSPTGEPPAGGDPPNVAVSPQNPLVMQTLTPPGLVLPAPEPSMHQIVVKRSQKDVNINL
ncbi:uncharacterized protein [Diadema setosum]|uniref:uncharacterized protein n=1 Tax=Diadema setosum TaxID=31175 RepID=UPI003B3B5836